jgi:hypothetical protein
MGIFRKYEFDSKEQFEDLKLQTNISSMNGTLVELGNLRNDKYSVDVLWTWGIPDEWRQYEIWDIQGNGSHTFLGYEFINDNLET